MTIAQFFKKHWLSCNAFIARMPCCVFSGQQFRSGFGFVFKLALGQEWLLAACALGVALVQGAGLRSWTSPHPGSPAHAHGADAAQLRRGQGCSLGVLFFPFGSSIQHILVFFFLVFFLELIYSVVLDSAVQRSESVIHICTVSQILFPYTFFQNIEQSSLYYAVGPYQLSILYTVVCIC